MLCPLYMREGRCPAPPSAPPVRQVWVSGAGRGYRSRPGCASSNRCVTRGLCFCCWLSHSTSSPLRPSPSASSPPSPPGSCLWLLRPPSSRTGRSCGHCTRPLPAPRPRPLIFTLAPLHSPSSFLLAGTVCLSRPRGWPRSFSGSHWKRHSGPSLLVHASQPFKLGLRPGRASSVSVSIVSRHRARAWHTCLSVGA